MSKPARAASGETRKRNMRRKSKGRVKQGATKRLGERREGISLVGRDSVEPGIAGRGNATSLLIRRRRRFPLQRCVRPGSTESRPTELFGNVFFDSTVGGRGHSIPDDVCRIPSASTTQARDGRSHLSRASHHCFPHHLHGAAGPLVGRTRCRTPPGRKLATGRGLDGRALRSPARSSAPVLRAGGRAVHNRKLDHVLEAKIQTPARD